MANTMNQLPLWMKGFGDPALLATLDTQTQALNALQDHLEALATAAAKANGGHSDETAAPAETGNDAPAGDDRDELLARLNELCRSLDPALLRTACSVMTRCVVQVATETAALLLADSVTELSDPERCQEKWARWLLSSRCWPKLVVDHWRVIRGQAEAIVSERLVKSSGITADSPAAEEIMAGLRELVLADVITPATYRAVFPEEEAEKGAGTGEAGQGGEATVSW